MLPSTLKYQLIVKGWQAGELTIREVELFVKTKWITLEQATVIYSLSRANTQLSQADPLTADTLTQIRIEVNQ